MDKRPIVFWGISFFSGVFFTGVRPGIQGFFLMGILFLAFTFMLIRIVCIGRFHGKKELRLQGCFQGCFQAQGSFRRYFYVYVISIFLLVSGYLYGARAWASHINRFSDYTGVSVTVYGKITAPFERKNNNLTAELNVYSIDYANTVDIVGGNVSSNVGVVYPEADSTPPAKPLAVFWRKAKDPARHWQVHQERDIIPAYYQLHRRPPPSRRISLLATSPVSPHAIFASALRSQYVRRCFAVLSLFAALQALK